MGDGHTKTLSIALLVAALLAAVLLSCRFRPAADRDAIVESCTERGSSSLTAAAAFFVESLDQGAVQAMGGGVPIEGFEPAMFTAAYPGIVAPDFECVEASQGVYRVAGGEIVFTATVEQHLQTSAGATITPRGMGILLENIGRRLGLPLTTEAEVREILRVLKRT
jgi:hypothetical protein